MLFCSYANSRFIYSNIVEWNHICVERVQYFVSDVSYFVICKPRQVRSKFLISPNLMLCCLIPVTISVYSDVVNFICTDSECKSRSKFAPVVSSTLKLSEELSCTQKLAEILKYCCTAISNYLARCTKSHIHASAACSLVVSYAVASSS